MSGRTAPASIRRLDRAGRTRTDADLVAVEAPLAVTVLAGAEAPPRALGVVMRTPGEDEELVLGLLHAEGVIRARADVIEFRARPAVDGDAGEAGADALQVVVPSRFDLSILDRATSPTSACGLCGRLRWRALDAGRRLDPATPTLAAATLAALPERLRDGQDVFAATGGLHAAALFDVSGRPLVIREDVGRHNAVDKVVGAALDAGWLGTGPLVLGVSGRVAYEIVQKAVMAGACAIVAVGAPSSLAVKAAQAVHLTLAGFARDGEFNVYAGADRVSGSSLAPVLLP